jgi:microcystin degradation protein MlrC
MKNFFLLLLFCLSTVSFCIKASAQQKLPRIGIAGLQIENSTFSPAIQETLRTREGQAIMSTYPYLHPDSVMGKGAVWLPALIAAGGSGVVTREAYETAIGKALEIIKANMPYDAFFFHIHGACSVQGLDDPEGIFLAGKLPVQRVHPPLILGYP